MAVELASASNSVTHYLLHAGFASDHIKHGRTLNSPGVPLPALDLLTAAATDVLEKVNSLSGILRVAVMYAVVLFPPFLPPRKSGMQHVSPRLCKATQDLVGSRATRLTCGPRQIFKNAKTLYFGDDRATNHNPARQGPHPLKAFFAGNDAC